MQTIVTIALYGVLCALIGLLTHPFTRKLSLQRTQQIGDALNGIYAWGAILMVVFEVPGAVGNLVFIAALYTVSELLLMYSNDKHGIDSDQPKTHLGKLALSSISFLRITAFMRNV